MYPIHCVAGSQMHIITQHEAADKHFLECETAERHKKQWNAEKKNDDEI